MKFRLVESISKEISEPLLDNRLQRHHNTPFWALPKQIAQKRNVH